MPHSPLATALIWSVSPPLGARAMLLTRPLQPGFGLLRAQVLVHRAEQRQVVRMRARARAQLALVARVGELLVGVDVVRLHGGLVVDDDARARREAEPLRTLAVVLAAQMGRDALVRAPRS